MSTKKCKFEFDGKKVLLGLIKEAGIESKAALVARHTLFTHPETVNHTKNKNLFQIIRDFPKRGEIREYNGLKLMACDNAGPHYAFRWSNGNFKRGKDIQINHIYSDSKNHEIYTSLANICATPSFIAKLTDTDEEIKNLLRFRAYKLYGFIPPQYEKPQEPKDYSKLKWMPFISPLKKEKLEEFLRKRLKQCPKSRMSISSRELGWYFSDFKPDSSI